MAATISQMTAAGALLGAELLELSVLSPTIKITATTLSALASDNSFNDSGNGFLTAGFAVDDRVRVTGFTGDTANNIFTGKITDLTAGKMTIGGIEGDVIVDDAAGESVTITKWLTQRTTSQEIADLAKAYVDGEIAKLASKKVRLATTAAITLATGLENGDTIDGVTLATGDRVLVKNQATGSENGIYVVAASGAPSRATDADSSAELVSASVWVSEGTANHDTLWTCTTDAPITVGTTALTFTAFSAGSSTKDWEILIAVGDESTALTTGTAKVTWRQPRAVTLTEVRASVKTAPTGSTIIVDINENGTSVLSTKLSIDASEKTSTTAASAAVISDSSLADDSEMTIDIDQVGSSVAGAGLKVLMRGTY